MCGLFYSSTFRVSSHVVRKLLQNRGSDDYNELFQNGTHCAHSRLIFSGNKDDGVQPVFIKGGNSTLLYNGEIYTFGDKSAYGFNASDTTVLASLLNEKKFEDVVNSIDGMYAIVVVNNDSGVVHCARDKYGQKPLYYALSNNGFVISSSSLLCAYYISSSPAISKSSMLQYMACGFVAKNSIYDNVFEVPPGGVLTFNNGVPTFSAVFKQSKCFDLFESLDTSINHTVRSNHRTAIALSSGIDSTAIASFYFKRGEMPDFAITVGSNDERYDESTAVISANDFFKFPLIIIRPSSDELLDAENRVMNMLEEPISDSGLAPNLLVAEAAKNNGAKILITGDGGDELFAGYNRHALFGFLSARPNASKIIEFLLKYIPRQILMAILGLTHHGAGALPERIQILENAVKSKGLVEFYLSALSGLSSHDIIFPHVKNAFSYDDIKFDLNNLLKLEQEIYLKGNNLYRSDRISLGVGIESRAPLLNTIVGDNLSVSDYDGKLLLVNYIKSNGFNYKIQKKMGFAVSATRTLTSTEKEDLRELIFQMAKFDIDGFKSSPYFNRRLYYLYKWLNIRNFL